MFAEVTTCSDNRSVRCVRQLFCAEREGSRWCRGLLICIGLAAAASCSATETLSSPNVVHSRLLAKNVEMSPASWSPSSEEVVFDSNEPSGVFVVTVESGASRRLASAPTFNLPAWSPSSKAVLVTDFSQPRRVLLLETAGGSSTETLISAPRGSMRTWPESWSPDGTRFIFLDDADLFIFDLAAGEALPGPIARAVGTATWASDGEEILVQRGLEVSRVPSDPGREVTESYGPARLYRSAPNGHVWILPLALHRDRTEDHRLHEVDRSSAHVSEWDFSSKVTGFDVASKSGRVVVAVDGVGIEILDPATGERLRLTTGARDQVPVWSPDETMIAFLRQQVRMGPVDLYVIPAPIVGG